MDRTITHATPGCARCAPASGGGAGGHDPPFAQGQPPRSRLCGGDRPLGGRPLALGHAGRHWMGLGPEAWGPAP